MKIGKNFPVQLHNSDVLSTRSRMPVAYLLRWLAVIVLDDHKEQSVNPLIAIDNRKFHQENKSLTFLARIIRGPPSLNGNLMKLHRC